MNYQLVLEDTISQILTSGCVPTLLLHSCCAPCSSYVLEYLSDYFKISVLYFNPNIYPESEYEFRKQEQKDFISKLPTKHPVDFIDCPYESERFYEIATGLEKEPERGARCKACFELRLSEAAKYAKESGFDYFTTTLSISPMKDANLLNEIGKNIAEEYGVKYLFSDFKKKNGYLRSTELSKEYGIYRQDYCGCVYSYNEREEFKKGRD